MIYHQHACITPGLRDPTTEVLAQIQDGEQLAADVGEPFDPATRTGNACNRVRHAHHLTRLFAGDQENFTGHPECDADPFATDAYVATLLGGCSAPALLHLE